MTVLSARTAATVAAVGFLLASCNFLAGCKRPALRSGDVDFVTLRQKVIADVKNGKIREDSSGKAALPKELARASAGGSIYVARDPALGLEIVFVDSVATADANENGTLYCEGDISPGAAMVTVGGSQWQLIRPGEPKFWMVTRM